VCVFPFVTCVGTRLGGVGICGTYVRPVGPPAGGLVSVVCLRGPAGAVCIETVRASIQLICVTDIRWFRLCA